MKSHELSFNARRCMADCFVILKGGTGTLVELMHIGGIVSKSFIPRKVVITIRDLWNNLVTTIKDELHLEAMVD